VSCNSNREKNPMWKKKRTKVNTCASCKEKRTSHGGPTSQSIPRREEDSRKRRPATTAIRNWGLPPEKKEKRSARGSQESCKTQRFIDKKILGKGIAKAPALELAKGKGGGIQENNQNLILRKPENYKKVAENLPKKKRREGQDWGGSPPREGKAKFAPAAH